VGSALAHPPPPRTLLSYVAERPLLFAPGSDYRYSNSDNVVVALIVQAVTGTPYARALREKVSGPLGLRATLMPGGTLLPSPFLHGYVGRELFGRGVQRRQFDWVRGHSEPPGPGRNSAGLAVFRYRTRCGTVFGHTGSILGYTQLIAASGNGRRSLAFTITTQAPDELLPRLRRAQTLAVCAALAG
jgi:D-alanyl-D-alanine carboxypeptidase